MRPAGHMQIEVLYRPCIDNKTGTVLVTYLCSKLFFIHQAFSLPLDPIFPTFAYESSGPFSERKITTGFLEVSGVAIAAESSLATPLHVF